MGEGQGRRGIKEISYCYNDSFSLNEIIGSELNAMVACLD